MNVMLATILHDLIFTQTVLNGLRDVLAATQSTLTSLEGAASISVLVVLTRKEMDRLAVFSGQGGAETENQSPAILQHAAPRHQSTHDAIAVYAWLHSITLPFEQASKTCAHDRKHPTTLHQAQSTPPLHAHARTTLQVGMMVLFVRPG